MWVSPRVTVMNRATRILLALVLTLAVAAPAAQAQPKKPKQVNVTVMTRNIYLGGNIFHPIGSPDLDTFKQRTSELWAEIQKTDFVGTRAALLAREVKRAKPDLVGLQEVAHLAAQPRRPVRREHNARHAGRLRLPEDRSGASSRGPASSTALASSSARPTSRPRSGRATTCASRCTT